MKTKRRIFSFPVYERFALKALIGLILMILVNITCVLAQQAQPKPDIPKDQLKRLELMKSKGVDGSLTILPVRMMAQPWERISEVVGVLLEQQGLRNIEISNDFYYRSSKLGLQTLADSVGNFVKPLNIKTDYVLYAEMNVENEKHAINELVGIVVDNKGEVVWTDMLNSSDEVFRQVDDPDPMGFSILLLQRLAPQMGLNEETARNAKPGKMTDIMNARSGMPPASEMSAMPDRQKLMKGNFKNSTLLVYQVRIGDDKNKQGTADLVKMINEQGICKAALAKDTMVLKTPRQDPNELKLLWDLARDFRDYARKNPQNADYMLYADYGMPGYVHFIVCDRAGEWVIADLQNSNHPDFRKFDISTIDGCNKLVINRLLRYLKASVADEIRESLTNSGVEAANKKFVEMKNNPAAYNLDENEMNNLGYEFLMAKKNDEAIAVFKMNVEAFPDSWNTYDSLGEAYAAAGDKENAIKNYEKSVQMNPGSPSGIGALKKLKEK